MRPINDGLPWTRDQSVLAFELYCRIPFQRTKASNPRVQELAAVLGRTPASVARKLGNFGAFDPTLARKNIVGLTHGSKLDKEVWNEFHLDWAGLVNYAQELKGGLQSPPNREAGILSYPTGPSVRTVTIEQRVHQSFFREAVLSSYEARCCITRINLPQCLTAGHIIPWSVNENRRADPTNGICLSATFDRLFDCGLISLEDDFTLIVHDTIRESRDPAVRSMISSKEGEKISLPVRFAPDLTCLRWHRDNVFSSNGI